MKIRLVAFPLPALGIAGVLNAQQPGTRAEQILRQREETSRSPLTPDTDKVEEAIQWAEERSFLTLFSAG